MPRRRNRGAGGRQGEARGTGEAQPANTTGQQEASRRGGQARPAGQGKPAGEGRPKGEGRPRGEGRFRPGAARQGGEGRFRPAGQPRQDEGRQGDQRQGGEGRSRPAGQPRQDEGRQGDQRQGSEGRPASGGGRRGEGRPGQGRQGAGRPTSGVAHAGGSGRARGEGRFRPGGATRPEAGGRARGEGRFKGEGRFRGEGRGRGDRRQPQRHPPRLPANGIRAKSQRGEFGESWWARRWIGVLEGFGYGPRLTRGRTYARDGAVLSIEVGRGKVSAKVQGSRATPYRVTIGIDPLSDAQWERAIDAMAEQALFAVKLLEGEMPQEIEEAFSAARVPLFPQSPHDLTTSCSCPDYANPCKHIAAVYYLLGERFDEDPFLIFELRGRTKAQVIDALRGRRAAAASDELVDPPVERVPALADRLWNFDEPGVDLDPIVPQIAAPKVDSGILRRYGPSPADTSMDIHAIYKMMTRAALERMFGGGSG